MTGADMPQAPAERLALEAKADWVWRETLKVHRRAPDTRVASSLSAIEALVALYYGGILRHDPAQPHWEGRDRLIVSKGHGSICLYPILADRGYFPLEDLERAGQPGCALGAIPDPLVPGYETINGSLGHGLGVACGVALALRARGATARVYVLVGDGELFEGSCWEAIMFAAHHHLDALTVIVDQNGASMLDFCQTIMDLPPLAHRFAAFGWSAHEVDGHDVVAIRDQLRALAGAAGHPKVLVARTVKGHGVPRLERDPMSHIRSLTATEVDELLARGLRP